MSDPKEQLSKEQLQHLMRDTVLPESGLDGLSSQEHPRAIVLARQPGAGKGSLVRAAEREFDNDVFVKDPDRLRDKPLSVQKLQRFRDARKKIAIDHTELRIAGWQRIEK